MDGLELEEIEVADTPVRRKPNSSTEDVALDSPPSAPSTPVPPSPPDPTSPTQNLQPVPPSPTTPTSPTGPGGGFGAKLPNIKIKKQYSKIFRIKTKILQNLGKADKTTDDIFDEFEANFSKQQQNANRLHKEVANYLRCCRALHGASKSLFETLGDVYEPEWVGHELLYAQAQNSDMLWTDFCHKVQDQTLAPLTAYQSQFPEIRKKIDKRGRKLVDYDSQRHQLENLQRATRRDEYKIARAQDALETARVTYEALNKELYDELPTLYDQRIPNVSNHIQSLFAAESTFMAESSKVAKELEAISDKLSKECAKGTYKTKQRATPRPLSVVEVNKPNSPSIRPTISGPMTHKKEEIGRPYEEIEFEDKKVNGTLSSARSNGEVIGTKVPPGMGVSRQGQGNESLESSEVANATGNLELVDSPPGAQDPGTMAPSVSPAAESALSNGPSFTSPLADLDKKVEEIYDIPVDGGIQNGTLTGATTEGLPQGVLYRVRATYKYTREDVDEISFEVGDIIQVVEYDDPEEQEEGWLCGIKEGSGEKGLFPANFTRPL